MKLEIDVFMGGEKHEIEMDGGSTIEQMLNKIGVKLLSGKNRYVYNSVLYNGMYVGYDYIMEDDLEVNVITVLKLICMRKMSNEDLNKRAEYDNKECWGVLEMERKIEAGKKRAMWKRNRRKLYEKLKKEFEKG